jgi:hypothetical protein
MTLVPDDDAEYYQAHKDDPEEWAEPRVGRKPAKRRLAAMISVRFTPEEEDLVRQAATERGESVSHFVRTAALSQARAVKPSMTTPIASTARTWTSSSVSFGTTTNESQIPVWIGPGTSRSVTDS